MLGMSAGFIAQGNYSNLTSGVAFGTCGAACLVGCAATVLLLRELSPPDRGEASATPERDQLTTTYQERLREAGLEFVVIRKTVMKTHHRADGFPRVAANR